LLTGRGFWHLSTFAAYSLLRVCEMPLHLVFEDDGTIDATTAGRLQAAFPGCRIHSRGEQDATLERTLPVAAFPTLRRDLGRFLLLRKITGPHLGATGRRLFIDSDVLFFRQPVALETWMRDGGAALIHMVDRDDQYGADRPQLELIAGHSVPPRVNTGFVGAASEAIDWRKLEAWARSYIAHIGHTHFLEQSLIAMLAGENPAAALPQADYIVAPSSEETKRPTAVAHHYAGPSRHLLYRHGWRHLVASR
jgi:hypothetical protein